jgi:hypothetical protein
MKLVEVAKDVVLCEVEVIRRTNEFIAEMIGWILIAVLREFGAEISQAEAKREVRRLRRMFANGGESYGSR